MRPRGTLSHTGPTFGHRKTMLFSTKTAHTYTHKKKPRTIELQSKKLKSQEIACFTQVSRVSDHFLRYPQLCVTYKPQAGDTRQPFSSHTHVPPGITKHKFKDQNHCVRQWLLQHCKPGEHSECKTMHPMWSQRPSPLSSGYSSLIATTQNRHRKLCESRG